MALDITKHDVNRTTTGMFDYQSVCHCSKTGVCRTSSGAPFDYQSVCHCSKTATESETGSTGLITSQFVTAPKHLAGHAV